MDASAQTLPRAENSADATFAAQRSEMARLIDRHCPALGRRETPLPGLVLFRGCVADKPSCTVVTSAFAMIAQGAKRILVGNETYEYDAEHYMLATVDLPISSSVITASQKEPYLGVAVELDPLKIAELAAGLRRNPPSGAVDRSFGIGRVDVDLQNTVLRLLRLLDTPDDFPVLGPIIERELLYRLLTGELGSRLQQATTTGSHSQQIVRVIQWMRSHLEQPASIDDLAELANMSRSSLHHHFKALTSMTPVQYQKQLRLHEARRLMLTCRHDAASAAHRVGYESPSQFSREYRRLFGAPPASDVAGLIAASGGVYNANAEAR